MGEIHRGNERDSSVLKTMASYCCLVFGCLPTLSAVGAALESVAHSDIITSDLLLFLSSELA